MIRLTQVPCDNSAFGPRLPILSSFKTVFAYLTAQSYPLW